MSNKHSAYINSYISDNLAYFCEEWVDWREQGILCDGCLRQLAKDLQTFYAMDMSQALSAASDHLANFLIQKKHAEFILN